MAWRYAQKDLILPFTAMVTMECIYVGLNIFFKAATSRGLSYYVFIVYSYAVATLLLLPLPFIFRRTGLPPFKLSLLFELFLLGLTRMESLSFRSSSSQAKVMGTLVSISGAMVVVLYKGPTILSTTAEKNWVKGGLLVAVGFLMFSTWSILQKHIMKTTCTDELVLAFLNNLCGTIISAPVCFLEEKELGAWIVRPGIPLLAILYSGAFGSSLNILVHMWGVNVKGPVYVSSFKPLSIAIAAASGVIFLGDDLHLGIVVGAVMLSIGLFAVLWGKAKEEEMSEDSCFGSLRGLPIYAAEYLLEDQLENYGFLANAAAKSCPTDWRGPHARQFDDR
ncbi:WAT1-related protein At4g15540 isoform X3 [Rosa chinensis]|uniref:WAT1-related protein At4g15540 isoform X3 n=1 Tax=Rosa chinensis TaxID=74649 RepID=UPI000D088819|nr:WAT1-related protein At4g15540 isoform X3 [Rosa chinensis]